MSKNILFYIVLFLSFIAFCAGAFYEVNMQGSGKSQLMELLSSYYLTENIPSLLPVFLSKAKTIFITWLILFICPIIPMLGFLSPILCLAKGISLGFSATMIIENFGYKGIGYIILSILPQSLIQLPIICLLAVFSIDLSMYTFKFYTQANQKKKNKNALLIVARHYVLVFILGLSILIICCLIEVFLMQFLL